ncbi:hypothetical protein VP01_2789g1 [Puccinia sorghi]|uniref:Uncharacterized protein n=1 Tax=Puccinia sorghi TaxID=27349 RepID=A0A0L6V2P4_9BASI|nr:hypothetical protein VP01_2789g1 [Puccinia sorghi]
MVFVMNTFQETWNILCINNTAIIQIPYIPQKLQDFNYFLAKEQIYLQMLKRGTCTSIFGLLCMKNHSIAVFFSSNAVALVALQDHYRALSYRTCSSYILLKIGMEAFSALAYWPMLLLGNTWDGLDELNTLESNELCLYLAEEYVDLFLGFFVIVPLMCNLLAYSSISILSLLDHSVNEMIISGQKKEKSHIGKKIWLEKEKESELFIILLIIISLKKMYQNYIEKQFKLDIQCWKQSFPHLSKGFLPPYFDLGDFELLVILFAPSELLSCISPSHSQVFGLQFFIAIDVSKFISLNFSHSYNVTRIKKTFLVQSYPFLKGMNSCFHVMLISFFYCIIYLFYYSSLLNYSNNPLDLSVRTFLCMCKYYKDKVSRNNIQGIIIKLVNRPRLILNWVELNHKCIK